MRKTLSVLAIVMVVAGSFAFKPARTAFYCISPIPDQGCDMRTLGDPDPSIPDFYVLEAQVSYGSSSYAPLIVNSYMDCAAAKFDLGLSNLQWRCTLVGFRLADL